jgi:hypothetical protein
MKRSILIVGLFILVIVVALYFIIPSATNFNYQTTANCTESAVARKLITKDKWQWWPGQKINDTTYSYKECSYKIEKILVNGIETTVYDNKDSVKGMLAFVYYGTDSTEFQWTSTYHFSANPFERFPEYFRFKKIKNNIENLLKDIKKYFDNQENIYGMKITKQKVTDASMIATKQTFSHYPSTHEIYGMINSVKEYIKAKGGEENNYPMLNVHREADEYETIMVAIPTKTDLPSEGNFSLKKMVLGNILMAEIKGGIYTVLKGEEEMTNYVNDYKKIAPAIPFESLVTNRLLETDTSKWITRLYYPIFF